MAVTKISATMPSATTPLVLLGQQTGVTIIPAQTPLTRLNYFDGKFLRAQDLQAEQNYLRRLTQLSNQANGFGIVNGFNVELDGGDALTLSAGLAIDPSGRVLLLGQEQQVSIQTLIDHSKQLSKLLQSSTLRATGGFAECTTVSETPPTNAVPGRDWYLLVILHAEALCGDEDVYGKLCEEACVTSTDRPYRLEGVVLRALPLVLSTPLAESTAVQLSRKHLQSLIASAFYSDEAKRTGSLISGAGLASDAWCMGAAGMTGSEIPIGVLVRDGSTTVFLDEWIARRELMETSPRRYWQWRMSMRPWDVYQAQINQFQCQLHKRFEHGVDTTPDDPCAEAKRLVEEAATHFKTLSAYYKQTTAKLQKMSKTVREKLLEDAPEFAQATDQYTAFEARLTQATQAFQLLPQNRLLINGGIIETPSAGYLPVVPGNTITVNEQVRRLMGEGVDLRFCVVRPDYIPHALEEAQHMERISLLQGLDNPNNKPKVDILVPYGKIGPDATTTGRYYEMRMNLIPENLELLALAVQSVLQKDTADKKVLGASEYSKDTASAIKKYAALIVRADRKNSQTLEYSGAAYADASEQGALSFYYAGITRPTSLLGTKSQAEASAQPAAEAAASGIRIYTNINSSGDAAKEATDPVSGSVMSRVLRLDTDLTAKLQRDIEARSAVWVSMEMAQDPTTLSRGKSVAVKAECILEITMELPLNTLRLLETNTGTENSSSTTSTAKNAVAKVLRVGFVGDFNVDDVAVRSGTAELREAKGTISGELTVSMRTGGAVSSQDQETFSFYLSEPVRIQRSMASNGPLFKILAADWSILKPLVSDIAVEREWKAAQKAEAVGVIHFQVPQQSAIGLNTGVSVNANASIVFKEVVRQAFRAWQTVNPQVSEPQHPAHEDAIRALRTIGAALGSSKFADLSAQRLFPAPKPASSNISVLATLDWVMFHRRREKICQQETPVLPIETRQYALYHVQLSGDQTLAEVRKQLERTAASAKLPTLDFVQLVEFGAGIHAVIGSHPQLQASWRQDVGNDAGNIIGGFIASHGVAQSEGDRLAQERLESLADVVAAVTAEDLSPDYQVLSRVPDSLDTPSNDGVIIVVTRSVSVSAINTHAVYGVQESHEMADLVRAAQAGAFLDALSKTKTAIKLGVVTFTDGVGDATQLRNVIAQWNALGYKPATAATVFANANDQKSADYLPQSTSLLNALGGNGASQPLAIGESLSTDPAITIVAGSVDIRRALFVYSNVERNTSSSGTQRLHILQTDSPIATGDFRNNLAQGNALRDFLRSFVPNRQIFGITLATVNGAPDARAPDRMGNVIQILIEGVGNIAAPTKRTEQLSAADKAELIRVGKDLTGIDEIYFFEPTSQ